LRRPATKEEMQRAESKPSAKKEGKQTTNPKRRNAKGRPMRGAVVRPLSACREVKKGMMAAKRRQGIARGRTRISGGQIKGPASRGGRKI